MHLAVSEATHVVHIDDKVKRRLTTVLCADVHGYSPHGSRRSGTLRTPATAAPLQDWWSAMTGGS
jgi:adenylate cyclase